MLLAGLLIEWVLINFLMADLPKNIPHTPINIGGLLLIGLIITILIFAQKNILKSYPSSSITNLTFLGSLIVLLSETIFQMVRQTTMDTTLFSDRLYNFLLGVIGVTLFSTGLSFMVAFQLKTSKTRQLIIYIIVFILLVNIIQYCRQTLGFLPT